MSLMYNSKGWNGMFLARNYVGRVDEKGELKGCRFIGHREIRLRGFCLPGLNVAWKNCYWDFECKIFQHCEE